MEIPLHVDPTGTEPIYRQIYDQFRGAILTGRLQSGARLPSSRDLAIRLGVARITVTNAYDRLVAEGYVETRVGSGTSVAVRLPEDATRGRRHAQRPDSRRREAWSRTSERLSQLPMQPEFPRVPSTVLAYDFRFGQVSFPMTEWQRIVARHWAAFEGRSLLSRARQGNVQLREEVARYLAAARAVNCTPDQIVITNSDQQALDLLAHVTLDPADEVVMEDPGKLGSRLLFQAHGARVVPAAVDAGGVCPDAVDRALSRRSRLLYLTPSHQYPTGVTLTLPRRLQLLESAARAGVLIVEDDWDSEYRYGGATLESLQGLDSRDVVVYMGAFTRVVGHAVRAAYLVVPPPLLEPVAALQNVIDRGPPLFVQSALAEFIRTGVFRRHLRRMERLHVARRDALVAALRERFGDDVDIGEARAGVHLHVRWRDRPVTAAVIGAAADAGVGLSPVAPLYVDPPTGDPGVVMIYSGLDEDRIREGVRQLARVFASLSAGD